MTFGEKLTFECTEFYVMEYLCGHDFWWNIYSYEIFIFLFPKHRHVQPALWQKVSLTAKQLLNVQILLYHRKLIWSKSSVIFNNSTSNYYPFVD